MSAPEQPPVGDGGGLGRRSDASGVDDGWATRRLGHTDHDVVVDLEMDEIVLDVVMVPMMPPLVTTSSPTSRSS